MVVIALTWALLSTPAHAIWMDQLFGEPSPAYFSKNYTKLLEWALDRYEAPGSLSAKSEAYLRSCAREASSWYLPQAGKQRLPMLRLTLKAQAGAEREVRIWCLRKEGLREGDSWAPGSADTKRSKDWLGLEFTLGKDEWRAITRKGEILFRGSRKISESERGDFSPGSPPELQGEGWKALVLEHAELREGGKNIGHPLELQAYVAPLAPIALRPEIEAIHKEFGFLADSWTLLPHGAKESHFP